jgi:hypothetical protein
MRRALVAVFSGGSIITIIITMTIIIFIAPALYLLAKALELGRCPLHRVTPCTCTCIRTLTCIRTRTRTRAMSGSKGSKRVGDARINTALARTLRPLRRR